jgi:hypothetical protein
MIALKGNEAGSGRFRSGGILSHEMHPLFQYYPGKLSHCQYYPGYIKLGLLPHMLGDTLHWRSSK